ncbi:hypothetical protein VHN57_08625 [Sphingobium sp. WW5]|uniref:hypothetical protein n=1 Tax=unclassified Sphingobium TaxID=2611147 RepID=UPI003C1B0CAF
MLRRLAGHVAVEVAAPIDADYAVAVFVPDYQAAAGAFECYRACKIIDNSLQRQFNRFLRGNRNVLKNSCAAIVKVEVDGASFAVSLYEENLPVRRFGQAFCGSVVYDTNSPEVREQLLDKRAKTADLDLFWIMRTGSRNASSDMITINPVECITQRAH